MTSLARRLTSRGRAAASVLLVAVAGTALPAVPTAHAAPPTLLVLTATLEVQDGDVIRDKQIIWNGPANAPIIRLNGTRHAVLERLTIDVNYGFVATSAIELVGSAGQDGPTGNHLSDIKIGNVSIPGPSSFFSYGMHWIGSGGGGRNTLTNIMISGSSVANISIENPSAVGNSFRGIYSFWAPIGFQSKALGPTFCTNCGFLGSHDVDVELTDGAGLTITGVYSETARSFARVVAGPGAGGLTVLGGYWQWSPKAAGVDTFTGSNTGGHRTWLRLTDFMVTPLNGTATHGTVSGFDPAVIFTSNVQGMTTAPPTAPGLSIR